MKTSHWFKDNSQQDNLSFMTNSSADGRKLLCECYGNVHDKDCKCDCHANPCKMGLYHAFNLCICPEPKDNSQQEQERKVGSATLDSAEHKIGSADGRKPEGDKFYCLRCKLIEHKCKCDFKIMRTKK